MQFKPGDTIIDQDGDIGVMLLTEPDTYGYVIWMCTKQGSKFGVEGNYVQSRVDELVPYHLYFDPDYPSETIKEDPGDVIKTPPIESTYISGSEYDKLRKFYDNVTELMRDANEQSYIVAMRRIKHLLHPRIEHVSPGK